MEFHTAGFDWDDGNIWKCQKHGVGLNEIEHVFRNDVRILQDRGRSEEPRFNAIGRNKDGRHLFVVFTLSDFGEMMIRPISARYMHRREVIAYERTEEA